MVYSTAFYFIPLGIKCIHQMQLFNDERKNTQIQYNALFGTVIPAQLLADLPKASICMEYGILGYEEQEALLLTENHLAMRSYNKLMTDDVIFSLLKK